MRHITPTLIALTLYVGEAQAAASHILTLNISDHYRSHFTFKYVSTLQSTVMGTTTTSLEQAFDQQIDVANLGYKITRRLTSAHVDISVTGFGDAASQQKLSQVIAEIPEVDYSTEAHLKPVSLDNIVAIKTYLNQALVTAEPDAGKLTYDTGFATLDSTSAVPIFARDDVPTYAVRNVALTVGQSVQLPSQPITAMGGVFHLEGTAVLKSWDDTTGTAHFTFTQQPTDAEMKAFVAASLHKLFDKFAGSSSMDIDSAIEDSKLTNVVTCEVDFDIATGLPKRSACVMEAEQIMESHIAELGKVTTRLNVTSTREYSPLP